VTFLVLERNFDSLSARCETEPRRIDTGAVHLEIFSMNGVFTMSQGTTGEIS
jgi:hypothetical protein